MSVLTQMLEYQKVDADLRKIEQEIAASEERKKFMQAKKFMESAGEKLDAQEKRAIELKNLAKTLTAGYKELADSVTEYDSLEEMVEEGGDIAFYRKNIQTLADRLRVLKGELAKLMADIESISADYKKMKDQTIAMQKQYKEYRVKFDELKNAHAAEVAEINAKLEKIAGEIPPEALAKYKAKRKARIFPVLAPLTGGRCICGLDFAIAQESKLAGGNVVECDHCHRLIYKQ